MTDEWFVIWRNPEGSIAKIDSYKKKPKEDVEFTKEDMLKKIKDFKPSEPELLRPELVKSSAIIEVLEFAGFGKVLYPVLEQAKNELRDEIHDIAYDLKRAISRLEDL